MTRWKPGKGGRARGLRTAVLGGAVGLGTLLAFPAVGQTPPDLVLLFTHDLHAAILPHRVLGPDDRVEIRGGFARIASMIRAEREKSGGRVLAVDAGDMIVGNLFQMLFQNQAPELRLLETAGFDAAGFGNHEFDFGPAGLARALTAAKAHGARLPLVASNTVFDPADQRDDTLETAWKEYPVRDYLVLERNGLRIGLFGLMGPSAADDSPDALPVTFADATAQAREMTTILRDREKADLVVALSHTGSTADGSKYSDLKIAEAAPGIDVIVSGHTHTRLSSPIKVGSTLIVSAGERGEDLGALGLVRAAGGRFQAVFYELRPVTENKPEDTAAAQAAGLREILNKDAETFLGYRPDMVAAETAFPLIPRFSGPKNEGREIGLGNLVTDAYRWAVRKAEGGRPAAPLLVVHPWGHLRDTLMPGPITVDDVYRVLSLGIGPDGRPGYPLVSIWLTGREIRRLFEVETTIAPGKEDAHLEISGASVRFNPKRVPFDRVTRVEIEDAEGVMRPLEPARLYRVVANIYMARMIEYVSRASYGILKLEPKDAAGRLRTDFENLIIDADPAVSGVQEIKEWAVLVEFLRSLPDTNGNGLPDVPASYASPAGRLAAEPSWNPIKLLAEAHGPTFILLGLIAGLSAILIIIVRAICRRRARRLRRGRTPSES
jgi:5'-nucleotidase/UDP-sugar diphosphatase